MCLNYISFEVIFVLVLGILFGFCFLFILFIILFNFYFYFVFLGFLWAEGFILGLKRRGIQEERLFLIGLGLQIRTDLAQLSILGITLSTELRLG